METSGRYVRWRVSDGLRWAQEEHLSLHLLSAAPWTPGSYIERTVAKSHVFGGDRGSTLLAPVAPSKVVCVGRNYAAHAAELGNEVPSAPLIFLKPPSSIVGPGAVICLPAQSERVEHEAELGIVVGQRLTDASEAEAHDGIFGYTCVNDVTARDLQRADVQFTRGKGFDTFCPVGPAVVRGVDPLDVAVSCRVNGDERQHGRTSQMIWNPFALVAYISAIMTLEPGDLIATGTPAGVGPIVAGDQVEVSIEGVGTLSNTVQNRQRPDRSGRGI